VAGFFDNNMLKYKRWSADKKTVLDWRVFMVRHICMFKMKEENKEANIAKAIELADELLKPIEYIKRYEVVVNSEKDKVTNYELSLIFDYDSSEDLEKYRVHPNHVKFGDFIKSVREARACIDYEFDKE